uniref:T6SS effector amidase Tae4 family protein n=1 Tax=Cupriavidus sp. EM10 TaxID=2839983 RepID=UPI00351CE63A
MTIVERRRVPATGKAKVKTSRVLDSNVCLDIEPVTFAELWRNYVPGKPHGNLNYKNQCAIRLSATLHRVGVPMKSFSESTSPKCPASNDWGATS